MLRPSLRTWVEEGNALASLRIDGTDTVAFEVVTARTRQPEILANSGATQSLRQQVFDIEWHAEERFRRVTIAASRACIVTYLTPKLG